MTLPLVVVDSSAVVGFVLQRPGCQAIETFLDATGLRVVLPDPGLTEVIYVSRREGNTTSSWEFPAALAVMGFDREPLLEHDLPVAADLHEMSQANPGSASRTGAQPATLSLGDSLILAVATRLSRDVKTIVVTRDQYWQELSDKGLLSCKVQAY